MVADSGPVEPFTSYGIHLPHEQAGKQRLACPMCDRARGDDALQVTVTDQRWCFWKCWRCAWEGGAPLDGLAPRRERPIRSIVYNVNDASPPTGLSAWASALLDACHPVVPGSPAAAYFRARGCALPTNDVLYHPALRHPSGPVAPALVAVVTDALTGERINLHRTWLAPDGSGKAPIAKPRLLLKGHRKHGGLIRLFPDEEVTTGLCVAEGIETALTAALGFRPVWACLDAGNLAELPVLPGIEALTIVADHDAPNPRTGRRAGGEAAEACAERWAEAGAEVRIWSAPAEGTDLNDFVTGAAA